MSHPEALERALVLAEEALTYRAYFASLTLSSAHLLLFFSLLNLFCVIMLSYGTPAYPYGLAPLFAFIATATLATLFLKWLSENIDTASFTIRRGRELLPGVAVMTACFLASSAVTAAVLALLGYRYQLSADSLISLALSIAPTVSSAELYYLSKRIGWRQGKAASIVPQLTMGAALSISIPVGNRGIPIVASFLTVSYAVITAASAGGYLWYARKMPLHRSKRR